MQLLDLPSELLDVLCENADNKTAKALRLTCKRLATIAARALFSHIYLRYNRVKNVRAIMDDDFLAGLVATLTLIMPFKHYGHRERFEPARDAYQELFPKLGRFRNLRRIEIEHSRHVIGPSQVPKPEKSKIAPPQGRESLRHRIRMLSAIMKGLNSPDQPNTMLRSLAILNLQDCNDNMLMNSDNFKAVIARIDCLELKIASYMCQENCAPPKHDERPDIEVRERHKFFRMSLRQKWLEPVREQLTQLRLSSTDYWGYMPKCDLRGLHFPHLRTLALNRMTFTHDWQVDWILSHGATLQALLLDDCPIVHDAWSKYRLDDEYYPICKLSNDQWAPIKWYFSRNVTHWSFATRWHDVFRRFQHALPSLRHFGFGEKYKVEEEELVSWQPSDSDEPMQHEFGPLNWSDRALRLGKPPPWPAVVLPSRYVCFYSCSGEDHDGVPWVMPDGLTGSRTKPGDGVSKAYTEHDGSVTVPEPLLYPDCEAEDKEALKDLRVALRERRK